MHALLGLTPLLWKWIVVFNASKDLLLTRTCVCVKGVRAVEHKSCFVNAQLCLLDSKEKVSWTWAEVSQPGPAWKGWPHAILSTSLKGWIQTCRCEALPSLSYFSLFTWDLCWAVLLVAQDMWCVAHPTCRSLGCGCPGARPSTIEASAIPVVLVGTWERDRQKVLGHKKEGWKSIRFSGWE